MALNVVDPFYFKRFSMSFLIFILMKNPMHNNSLDSTYDYDHINRNIFIRFTEVIAKFINFIVNY